MTQELQAKELDDKRAIEFADTLLKILCPMAYYYPALFGHPEITRDQPEEA